MYLLTKKVANTDKIDAIATLDFDTRVKSRARISLDNSSEAGLYLERGTLLRGGDILSDDSGKFVVLIKAASEKVSIALCVDPLKLAIACYHLGNRHVPLQIESGRILYLHDHVLDNMLIGLNLIVGLDNLPFEPVSGAYETGLYHNQHDH